VSVIAPTSNARPDAGRLAPGIPPSNFWASDPNGINQVGCVYTAQGFEFDYVGVIWGRDLTWDPATNTWLGDSGHSHDSIVKRSGDRFTDLVKRTYRVLLTRGLKGCYVFFDDPGTRSHMLIRQVRTVMRKLTRIQGSIAAARTDTPVGAVSVLVVLSEVDQVPPILRHVVESTRSCL
jgi:hypothetical protein